MELYWACAGSSKGQGKLKQMELALCGWWSCLLSCSPLAHLVRRVAEGFGMAEGDAKCWIVPKPSFPRAPAALLRTVGRDTVSIPVFHKLLSILSEPGKAEALSVPFQNIFAVGSGWLNCKDSVVKQKSSSFLHFLGCDSTDSCDLKT